MEWNVEDYNKNAYYVYQYGQDLLKLLAPKPKEYILDLGCGNGVLTEQISLRGSNVIGIDASKEMVLAARTRGVETHTMEAEEINYHNKFDAVFSNAALHWMKDADKILKNVYRSLKKRGRFCAEMGGEGNVQTITSQIYLQLPKLGLNGDSYNPWYFPNKKEVSQKLKNAGFHIKQIEAFDRLTPLPTDIAGWLRTFAKPFLIDVPKDKQEEFINTVKDNVSDNLQNEKGEWFADYVRLRFLVEVQK